MRRMTYAVRWRENDGPEYAGGLLLRDDALELAGRTTGRTVVHLTLPYDAVRDLHLERAAQLLLVVLTRDGDRVVIASLQGLGALHELADQLTARRELVLI
jgi:hypothetical protein